MEVCYPSVTSVPNTVCAVNLNNEHVLNAIPKSCINLVQNTFVNIDGSCELLSLLFTGKDLKAMLPNKLIHSCCNSVLYPTSLYQNGIVQAYDKPTIQKV